MNLNYPEMLGPIVEKLEHGAKYEFMIGLLSQDLFELRDGMERESESRKSLNKIIQKYFTEQPGRDDD